MFFKKRGDGGKKGEDPPDKLEVNPNLSNVAERRKQWIDMGVPQSEVAAFGNARGRELTPVELISIMQRINKELRRSCFEFEVTYHQALGAMVDQIRFMELKGEDLTLPYIAIWQWADRFIREQYDIEHRAALTEERQAQLKKAVEGLLRESAKRAAERKATDLGEEYGTSDLEHQPMARKSGEELADWEATIQTLRKFNLKPTDAVPKELMVKYLAELESQKIIAREQLGIRFGGKDKEK